MNYYGHPDIADQAIKSCYLNKVDEHVATGKARAQRAPRRDGSPLLVKGTLNVNDTLPLPMGLYKGGAECEAANWVPDALYEQGAYWIITQKCFSSGAVQVMASLGLPWTKPVAKLSPESVTTSDSPEKANERFSASIRRSRKLLRERVMELCGDHMITLGKRGKFDSCDAFWKAWDKFNRLCAAKWPHWKAVVVPELHADGVTWHAHVVVKGFHPHTVLWFLWQKALGGKGSEHGKNSLGSVRIDRIKVKGKSRGRCARVAVVSRIAAYVSKYVGKGFGPGNRGRKLFAASRDLTPHRVERWRCDYRGGLPQLAFALLGKLTGIGSSGRGTVFRWHRVRADESLVRCGFFLTTDWSGVQ